VEGTEDSRGGRTTRWPRKYNGKMREMGRGKTVRTCVCWGKKLKKGRRIEERKRDKDTEK